ncbi:UpxY family transcription antiterminator [Aquimarina sp. RZ0]|uniref:UpxY family transcription antiterminator n=1 Tax=Aquimarina sp. RZ0 TaxID=2607730 RepID=UPI0011F2ACD1|nr:UpxY family transcription antiterminator [Aquimarina sp. RZ0]KAA1246435.1 UpxY family transcription antiterminator [Aquimarina sp. RZ0]
MRINQPTAWYVLYVKPRHEKKIENLLKEKQIETYLPLVKTIRKWSDRKKMIESPLFPSYLFVKIDFRKDSENVLSIRGFCTFIRFGSEFAKVQDHEIKSIRLLTEMSDVKDIENSDIAIKVGEYRRVQEGALSGLDCEIINVNNVNKIIVRIDSIKHSIMATLPSSFLSELEVI